MKPVKKLAIQKETVRQLSDIALEEARGGYGSGMQTYPRTYCQACWGNSTGVRCQTFANGCDASY